jgi:heat shock protein HtpX
VPVIAGRRFTHAMVLETLTIPSDWTGWLAACVATLPAFIVWRLYTPLLRRLDDPVLAERLASRGRMTAGIAIAGIAITAGLWPRMAIWTVPLALVALLRTRYGVRRILLGENLTFSGYLSWVIRYFIAVPGFWLLIALAPAIILASGNYGPLAALLIGIFLILWQGRAPEILLRLWRATPLQRDDLDERFAALADKTDLAPPRVWQAGEFGAVFANAFALPSPRGASVVFTRTLIERLTVDEIAAIHGHEIAHLEYFKPARLRRMFVLTLLQAVAAVLLVPALTAFAEPAVEAAVALWPFVVLATLLARASRVHANELESDRRAVELCGNPDALISALEKVHAIARLRTRWESRSTTHPSLSRRVRAIREAAGHRASLLEEPVVIDGLTAGVKLIFEKFTLRHLTGVPADEERNAAALVAHASEVRRFAYDEIKSCRVTANGTHPPHLVVESRDRRRVATALRDADVRSVQAVLDTIEHQIPDTPVQGYIDYRILALIGLCLSLISGPSWALAFAASLAFAFPTHDMMLATALMAIASGVLGVLNPAAQVNVMHVMMPGAIAVAGILMLAILMLPRLRARAADTETTAPSWVLASVALAAVTVWAIVALQWDGGVLRLVQHVRTSLAVVVLPLGAAVLFARSHVPHRRVFAAAFLLAAIAPAAMMPPAFQSAVIRDPLLAAMPELPRVPAKLTLVSQAALKPGEVVRVSLTGQSVATGWRDEEHEYRATPSAFAVRTAAGRVEQIAAADLQFLDDTRVLLLRTGSPGLELAVHTLGQDDAQTATADDVTTPGSPGDADAPRASDHRRDLAPAAATMTGRGGPMQAPPQTSMQPLTSTPPQAPPPSTRRANRSRGRAGTPVEQKPSDPLANWTLRLPDFVSGRLSVDPRTGRWRVAGVDKRGDWVRVQGVLGNEMLDEARWNQDSDEDGYAFFDAGRTIVSLTYAWPTTLLGRIAPRLAELTSASSSADVSLWRTEADRRTPLVESDADVSCHEAEVNAGSTICLAFDGIDTRIWAIDADQGALRAVGFLPGRAYALSRGLDGSVLVWWRRRPVIVHPRSPRAIELDVDAALAAEWRGSAYTSGHLVVAGSGERAAAGISTYEIAIDERVMPGSPARAAADRAMLDGR